MKKNILSVIIVALVACGGYLLADLSKVFSADGLTSTVSPVLIAILLGMLVNNTTSIGSKCQFGIDFGIKYVLKLGIILLGFGISATSLLTYGKEVLPVVTITIFSGITIALLVAKLFKIDFRIGALIGVGSSICGITAIATTSPVINAQKEQSAYAISIIALFGTLCMIIYPSIVDLLFISPLAKGVFLGASTPDTSQAIGAGLIYSSTYGSQEVLDIAITTKLIRNMMMIIAIPTVGFLYIYRENLKSSVNFNYRKSFPLFVVGFLALAIVRSTGDFILAESAFISYWGSLVDIIKFISKNMCLIFAMAAIGLSTNLKSLLNIGYKPFVVGFIVISSIGFIDYLSVSYFIGQ